ncbi:transcriptional regulator [Marinibactrum halimedae]|uniref:HTH cro/C1-type domain-containing protein n=1 Tax=Marinibactrum halimedae TaxID=1444977 RepID=A0AA37TCD4_9GAMM|nr:Cro/CI family transcriptional regulator [Marinibactrum halimedae]MCD9458913.1 helix-turn-helix domain-containing protein [Marinibactrum halimedae]GLS27761.1 hypothetical protein GCM10007877_34800 [Marinibactrum halimedae]
MPNNQHVKRVAKIIGTQVELAKRLGVKPATVNQWVTGVRRVPPIRAVQMEDITDGVVSRIDLCPNFPWQTLEKAG